MRGREGDFQNFAGKPTSCWTCHKEPADSSSLETKAVSSLADLARRMKFQDEMPGCILLGPVKLAISAQQDQAVKGNRNTRK